MFASTRAYTLCAVSARLCCCVFIDSATSSLPSESYLLYFLLVLAAYLSFFDLDFFDEVLPSGAASSVCSSFSSSSSLSLPSSDLARSLAFCFLLFAFLDSFLPVDASFASLPTSVRLYVAAALLYASADFFFYSSSNYLALSSASCFYFASVSSLAFSAAFLAASSASCSAFLFFSASSFSFLAFSSYYMTFCFSASSCYPSLT